jgi:hypothetical protein
VADTFTLDLRRFGEKTEKQMSQIVRKICFGLYTLVVTGSPVITGRFRANNSINLNDLPSGSTLEVDKDGTATLSKGASVLANYKLGDTVFIYNNVEYAMYVEFGPHRVQAPAGVYRVSVQEIISKWGV